MVGITRSKVIILELWLGLRSFTEIQETYGAISGIIT